MASRQLDYFAMAVGKLQSSREVAQLINEYGDKMVRIKSQFLEDRWLKCERLGVHTNRKNAHFKKYSERELAGKYRAVWLIRKASWAAEISEEAVILENLARPDFYLNADSSNECSVRHCANPERKKYQSILWCVVEPVRGADDAYYLKSLDPSKKNRSFPYDFNSLP